MKKKIFIAFVVLVVAVGVAGMWAYQNFFGSAVEERFSLVLRSDESYDDMVAKVERYIERDLAFKLYAKRINLDEGIEAGTYTFDKGMTVIEVARTLKFGCDNSVRLVINNARTPEALAGKIAMQIDADSVSMLAALRSETLIEEFGFDSAEAMFSIFLP
ncbi:MAG: endolytic transglycosylase MltG, partial [Alistipes sp.]|nr:endolytic transglycosylase MltG [Alistipes sp.]